MASLPSARLNLRSVYNLGNNRTITEGTDRRMLDTLNWSVTGAELGPELVSGQGVGPRDGQCVLHYQHPLRDQDRIEYEFFYRPAGPWFTLFGTDCLHARSARRRSTLARTT